MKIARFFPTFTVVFLVCYGLVVYFNLALFTYRPAVHQFFWFVPPAVKGVPGIPMFWYGWLSTTLIVTLVITALSALVPAPKARGLTELVWIAPIFAFAIIIWALRIWFTL